MSESVPESSLIKRVEEELAALRERSQFRTLENPPGINLYSNDYLGLARDPCLKEAVLRAVEVAECVGGTGSRLLSGNSVEWEGIERQFAEFAGTEASVYFGSGYAANIGLVSSIARKGDLIFSDELNHASLIDGIRLSGAEKLIYPHANLKALEQALHERASEVRVKLIVTETLFSMDGDVAPIKEIVELAERYGAHVIVDEAHAVGVYGPEGRGFAAAAGLQRKVLASVYTCGKALASAGAFVCCGHPMRDYLINRARTFIFSTAMPSYMAGQIRAALELARGADDRREHLAKLSQVVREALKSAGVDCGASNSQIIPLRIGNNEAALYVAGELQRAGFAVRAIRPPTVPEGEARVRLSLTAALSHEDAQRLVAAAEAAIKSAARRATDFAPGAVHA